jgi:hypothetical protein
MSEDSRVKRWRDTKRQRGQKALTIWLTEAEEMRLKDLALQAHCSPSALIQQALSQFTHTTSLEHSSPPDTSLIRQLIREELATMQAAQGLATVEDTVIHTDTPTDVHPESPTEIGALTKPSSQARAYGEVPSAVLAALAQHQAATAAELAKAVGDDTKAGTKSVWQALQRLLKRGAVIREGQQYRLSA